MILTITIDTEFSTHKNDIGVFGDINGIKYGISKIVEICAKYGIKATFFIDVYSAKARNSENFKKACLTLKASGHDLQLHTHPDGMFDKNRGYMALYSRDEQIDIIRKGKKIFEEWFSVSPIAHRAGDWGANYDTLEALQVNGVPIDSSMFYGWKGCCLNNSLLTKNKPVKYKEVLEIPATIFYSFGMGVFKPYRLVSTDNGPYEEVMKVINKMKNNNSKIITTVFHSFSFLGCNSDRTKYWPLENRIRKFDKLLNAISKDNEVEVKTMSDIYEIYRDDEHLLISGNDSVSSCGLNSFMSRCLDRLSR